MSKTPQRSLARTTAKGMKEEAGMSTAETAQYIVEFTAELSYLARQKRLDLLAYLLDMARLEAISTLQAEKERI